MIFLCTLIQPQYHITFANFITMSIQAEKIFGPGNQYVTAAKMILQVCSCSSIVKLYHYLLCQDIFSMVNCFCGSNFYFTAEQ